MNNNELKVKCVNDLVDGISKGLIYDVSVVRKREDGLLGYFIKDDYGQYNEFKSNRFEIVECYIEI